MNFTLLFISGSEIIVILLVALLLFGAKKIPEIARGIGKGMREFRKATEEIKKEINKETNDIENDIKKMKDNITGD